MRRKSWFLIIAIACGVLLVLLYGPRLLPTHPVDWIFVRQNGTTHEQVTRRLADHGWKYQGQPAGLDTWTRSNGFGTWTIQVRPGTDPIREANCRGKWLGGLLVCGEGMRRVDMGTPPARAKPV